MTVRIEKTGPVWTVIHDRPEARNAMDPVSADALTAAFLEFDADKEASVAVLHARRRDPGGNLEDDARYAMCGRDRGAALAKIDNIARQQHMPDFNWALDYFDPMAVGNENQALWIVEESGEECRLSFAALASRSNQVANWLRAQDVQRGDRLLLMVPPQEIRFR